MACPIGPGSIAISEMDARTPKTNEWRFCPRCEELLRLDDYYANRNRPNGRTCYCKRCTKKILYRMKLTVTARRVRQHIVALSFAGVGHRTVAELSGVDDRTISKIKNGRQKRITRKTEQAILAVNAGVVCDRAYVPAYNTHQRLYGLDRLGFTRIELARRLGITGKRPHLNFGGFRAKLTARKALTIEKLYNQIMRERQLC
jgi:plasmid maintenance system antidote protein VapI